ncbi:MAG: hydroxyethylthiazole kinase [Desulfobacterales bacterium]|nr:hydroxyethylthiazole kinase [Desulfobacterales bacterium]
MQLNERAALNLSHVREKKPLIHNITNFVVMNYTANALLAMGASPVMAHSEDEVEEMVSFAGALVLNIGTLTIDWVNSMLKAGKMASKLNKPIILDPVGSGATSLRTNSAKKIIKEVNLSVIRGNASEIISLKDLDSKTKKHLSDLFQKQTDVISHQSLDSKTKGVDSIHSVDDASSIAKIIANEFETIVAITGPTDFVTDGKDVILVSNGHPLMGCITGTGCTATAIIGAFLAVDKNPMTATATALAFFGLAGEMASKKAEAPGSFMIELINALYTITPEDLKKGCKIN